MKKQISILTAMTAMAFIPSAYLAAADTEPTLEELAERIEALEEMVEELQETVEVLRDELNGEDHEHDSDHDDEYIEGDGTGNIVLCHKGRTIRVGVAAMWVHLGQGVPVGACDKEFIFKKKHQDHDDHDHEEEHDHTEHLEIEVEIHDGEAHVAFDHDGAVADFTVDSDDEDDIIEAIADKFNLSESDVEAVIEFEDKKDDHHHD